MTAKIHMHENNDARAIALNKAIALAKLPSEAYQQAKLTMRKPNLDAMNAYLDE